MKFVKLRLAGFKTFVEPTDVPIEAGMTGVVGPNGCGKSNLVEALRWVMGESSSKSLRASGMDDVIFSGSGRRPSRDRAEVTLVLDNADRSAPAGFNDADTLEVTRRIEREAGSVYRVNGRDVRARDVQLLFADASTGARSPALVRQGQIGELIAARPAQRRGILEEAAGITGLHSRRHEAELRLRAAEQNLERVEDVIKEIEGRLDGLRRQARQASRYRNLSGEIRKVEAALFYLKWIAACAAVTDAEEALAASVREVEARAVVQASAARDQAVAAAAMPPVRDREAAASAALQRLRIAAEALAAEERRTAQRIAELDRRAAEAEADAVRAAAVGEEAEARLAALDAEDAALAGEEASAATRVDELAAAVAAAEATLAEAESALSDATRRAADAAARRSALERSEREAATRLATLDRELGTLARERGDLDAALAGSSSDAPRTAFAAAEAALAEAEASLAAAESAASAAREREAATRGPAQAAETVLTRLEAEAKALARVLAAASSGGAHPPVLDHVSADKGFERALAAALGDDLEASLAAGAPSRWEGAPSDGDPPLPDGATPLSAHVRVPPQLARRLAQIGLVEPTDAPALRPWLKPGQRLVSRAGDLWRWDGFVADADAPTAAAQRLAERNRLAEVEAAAAGARTAAAEVRAAHAAAQAGVAPAATAERTARETVRARQAAVGQTREALAKAERRQAEIAARARSLAELAERRSADRTTAADAHAASATALAESPPPGAEDAAIAERRAAVAERRAAAGEVRAVAATLAREGELRGRRRRQIVEERKTAAERAASATAHRTQLLQRRAEIEAERVALADAPAEFGRRRRSLAEEIASAESTAAAATDARTAGEAALAVADRASRDALEALSAARELRGRGEERLAAARERRGEIEAAIAEALDGPPEEAAKVAGIVAAAPLPDAIALEQRLERLKLERERLGGVNLRAEEEVAEAEERRDTLVAERDELVEAIRRLRQAIQTLNGEARQRLLAAFQVVDSHFRSLFRHLFDGGEGELTLVDSDDPLEAGLEIVARPPGKKPQTLTLLSGGEQALTTMALIFAVFLTNPAPICVLDEVDAPLDDANVERFCDLVAEMTRRTDTRFLIVTHNPITMARMHRLFGVTMAERGVSQVVSVSLETAEAFREAG
jgi:chromosome segregation protein